MSQSERSEGELPAWYVYADRLTATGRPFYVGIGIGRDRFNYDNRPPEWHQFVRAKGAKALTALEQTRLTRRQANRHKQRLIDKWKPQVKGGSCKGE